MLPYVSKWITARPRRAFAAAVAALCIGLSGCFSNDNGSEEQSNNGQIVIGLTDAAGDFSSYSVDVTSLTLTKANGAVVETLPVSTRVDFSQYVDLTEFLTAATVPRGVYTSAVLTLDYSSADIWVEDTSGNAVQIAPADMRDEDGNALTTLQVSVRLDGRNSLLIAPGVPSYITLDFDLDASNRVTFNGTTPELTVRPILLADVSLERPKIHRVRGPLADVNVAASSFEVILRPFIHAISNDNDRSFGTLEVKTAATTSYEINGQSYQGVAGLTAMDALPTYTATVVVGDIKANPRRFEAREVYAGSSVPGGTLDVVTGNVIARSGDVLTVRGATLIRAGGAVVFRDTVTVTLDANTVVRRQLSIADFTTGDISVGQRVMVFGNAVEGSTTTMTADRVRMLMTSVRGTRVSVVHIPESPMPLALDVQSIDGRKVGIYDFAGTGTSDATDADPANYEIDTGALDVSAIEVGAPVRAMGFVTPFGAAPADFVAQTVVDLSDVPAVMTIGWQPARRNVLSLSAGLNISLTGAGVFHHVGQNGVVTDLTTLDDTTPTIMPPASGEGLFWIDDGARVEFYTTYAGFSAALQTKLDNNVFVKGIVATGQFDAATATLTSGVVAVAVR